MVKKTNNKKYTPSQKEKYMCAKHKKFFTDELLKNHHLFIAPGTVFGSQGEGYVRFSLCVKEEQIQSAIKRIGS